MKRLLFPVLLFITACSPYLGIPLIRSGRPLEMRYAGINYCIDAKEVTNLMWKEYLYHSRPDIFTGFFNHYLNNGSLWSKVFRPDTCIPAEYFENPRYNNYPVAGISYEQAMDYCRWRTRYVDSFGRKYYGLRITIRLPTEKEWETFASDGLDLAQYPYGFKKIYNDNCGYLFTVKNQFAGHENCKYAKEFREKTSFRNTVGPADAHWPNQTGFYNVLGNVAEMVSEKGKAKGGSYAHMMDSCAVRMVQYYDRPQPWLGFRCVADIGP